MKNLVIITGPGMGQIASSSFPDADRITTLRAWNKTPERVWQYFAEQRHNAIMRFPNQAHQAIHRLYANGAKLITQNLDNLHEQAGSKPLHLLGELFMSRCSSGCSPPFEDYFCPREGSPTPTCKHCGALVRPHVCLTGEAPYQQDVATSWMSRCKYVLIVGTLASSYPTGLLPLLAKSLGAVIHYAGAEAPNNDYLFDQVHIGPVNQTLPRLFAT